jgi:Tfp pilus assembly protein PilF
MKILNIALLIVLPFSVFSQKSKVQGAWRSLSDYESTLNDNPDVSYLLKAKESIDLATANEETKNQVKTYAYRFRIYINLFSNSLKEEEKKLTSIADKNERLQTAYGNVATSEFDEASKSLNKIKELDLKKFEKISKGETDSEEDGKLFTSMSQLQVYSANLATGKYKVKKFDEAADFFESLAISNTFMTGKKDTSNFYNACVCAQKAKNTTKMFDYNKKMIDENIASPYNYQTIYDLKLSQNDTAAALEYLKIGRTQFTNDVYLMNKETELFLQKGEQAKALANLQTAIAKEPNNAVLQYVIGNVYDNLANPKGKSGKDTIKPADYEDLVTKAAEHYQKAVDLKPASQDGYFNTLYNLGALYNNYGNTIYAKAMEKATIADLAKNQKGYEAKSMDSYKKAIPYLEQALSIKPDDKTCISALRTLYYKTGNEAKGKEMSERMKK